MKKNYFIFSLISIVLLTSVTIFNSSCSKNGGSGDNGTAGTTPISCNNVTSNTTLPLGVYSIDCALTVTNNATLTFTAGSTIKFTGNGELITTNGGAINALGTAAAPIVFTGIQETQGYWYGIDIFSNSTNNVFKYCKFKCGGKGSRSMVRVGDGNGQIGRAVFQNCLFTNGLKNGIYIAGDSYLTNNVDNSSNDTLTANHDYPVSCNLNSVIQLNNTNVYTGNGKDYIYVSDAYQIYTDIHFHALSIPYELTATSNNQFDIYGNWVVDPGVTLSMDQNMELYVGSQSGKTGTFNCVGTAANRITIKGTQSAQGFWDKIRFENTNDPRNQIQYCNIQDGGSNADNLWTDPGMISVVHPFGKSNVTIKNCNFSNSSTYAIYIRTSNGTTGAPNDQIINGLTGATYIYNSLKIAGAANNTYTNCTGAIYVL